MSFGRDWTAGVGLDTDDRGGGGGGAGPLLRDGSCGAGEELGPREGRGGAGDDEFWRLTDDVAADEVLLGGGGKGSKTGFVFLFTMLCGGGGGGAGWPLYGSQLVFFIGILGIDRSND